MSEKEDEGMHKYGVKYDEEKTKTAEKEGTSKICSVCGKDLDDAGACPVHGTEPLEPHGK